MPAYSRKFMDNKKIFIFCGLAILLIIVAGVILDQNTVKAGAEEQSLGAIRPFGLERVQDQTATTSPTYKAAASASSTKVVSNMDQIASVDLRFMAYSTTTPPTISYAYYQTFDNVDWFYVGAATSAISTSTNNLYGMKSFAITDLKTKALKIEYTVTGAAADTYLEVIKDPK